MKPLIECLSHHLAFIPTGFSELTATEFAEILIEMMQFEGYAFTPIVDWKPGANTMTVVRIDQEGSA